MGKDKGPAEDRATEKTKTFKTGLLEPKKPKAVFETFASECVQWWCQITPILFPLQQLLRVYVEDAWICRSPQGCYEEVGWKEAGEPLLSFDKTKPNH